MGLRAKIIGVFFIGFSLLSTIGVLILQNNLKQSYSAIEKQEAIESMHQLSNAIDDKFGMVSQLTNDWAYWDQMVNFVQHQNEDFRKNEIGSKALNVIGMDFAVILNTASQKIFFETPDGRQPEHAFDDIVDHVIWRTVPPGSIKKQNCGLDRTGIDVYLVCWQQILHADMSGDKAGLLILGHRMDEKIKSSLLKKASSHFEFILQNGNAGPEAYRVVPTFDSASIQFRTNPIDTLNATLFSIVGKPLYTVQFRYPKEISKRGDDISQKVISVLLVIAFLNGFVLLTGVHTIVIRRLDKMVAEVNSIRQGGQWSGAIDISERRDELYTLGYAINQMLTFIRQQLSNLESIANTDTLTKIGNRLAFDQRISVDLSIAKRNVTGRMSLLLIDVDYFKQYNDHYGHPAGDEVLKTIARLMKSAACRPSDLCTRIGGEEFAIILPTSHIDGAVYVANKLIAKLAEAKIAHERSPIADYVTISIGVTIAVDTDNETTILKRADEAMYKAKISGRNKVCVIESGDVALRSAT